MSFAAFALLLAGATGPSAPPADGWVVLPVDEYRALREKAFPREPEPDPPPTDATLSRVDYDLRLDGDGAHGEARLTIDVLKDGWVKVAIPSGLLVREARLGGRPVSLIDVDGKGAEVLLSRAGRSVLVLEVAVPVAAAAGTETLRLPPAPSAIVRADLVLARRGVEVAATGGFLAERAASPEGTRVVAHGRGGEALVLSWHRRRDDRRVSLPLRLRGSVTQWVGLGEEGAQLSALVELEVVQGSAASVSLALPDGVAVNRASGALVAEWEARPGALEVSFLEPLSASSSILIAGEAKVPREGAAGIPLLRLTQAEREGGGVAVEVLGAGEVLRTEAKGLDAADASELGGPVAGRDSPSLTAFRFRPQPGGAPRALVVTTARYAPEAILVAAADEARYRALLTEDGKALVEARYAVRNNQRSFLAVTLPGTATLWSASVAGRPVKPGRSAEGTLLLPLDRGRGGEEARPFAVELTYLDRTPAWAGRGRATLRLPALDVPVARSGLELRHPPRYAARAEPGLFRAEPFEAPASPVLRGRGARAPEDQAAPSKDELTPEARGLLEGFRKEREKRRAGILPVAVVFPDFGPVSYLASELAAEGQAPEVTLAYRRTGKGGVR
jgi:hypothetical protein